MSRTRAGPILILLPAKSRFLATTRIAFAIRSARNDIIFGWAQFLGCLASHFPAGDHQSGANHHQSDAGGWGEEVAAFGVHAYVDVTGIEAVMFGVGDGDEEGENSED